VFSDDGREGLSEHPNDEAEQTHARCPTPLAAVGEGLLHAFAKALAELGRVKAQ
jgi:hypothetical protein